MTSEIKVTKKKLSWSLLNWLRGNMELDRYHYQIEVTMYHWDDQYPMMFVAEGCDWIVTHQDNEFMRASSRVPIPELEQNTFKTEIYIYE